MYQSYRRENVPAWISTCLNSVESWARGLGVDYKFYGDELFDRVPDWYREKTCERLVVATDLARLVIARELLEEGYDRVVWCDADLLVFAPEKLKIQIEEEYAFGREVWVQKDDKERLRAYSKIHNAFFVFTKNNSFLDFYIHACLSIVQRMEGPMVPQIVGPKFLSAVHNIINCPVVEEVGMFSPLVVQDILTGTGAALDLMKEKSVRELYAANLSASMQDNENDGICLSEGDMERACLTLLGKGAV